MALADAQGLAIRKLLSRATSESAITPGPPLPKSHPSPALLAKLHLECAEMYAGARVLVKTPGDDVRQDLRKYLAERAAWHKIQGLKWLGVDAGEAGRGGEAVGFLKWAKEEGEEEGIEGFLRHYTKANDTLHFEVVVGKAELQARVPAGRMAVAARPYVPPTPGFGPGSVEFERRRGSGEEKPQEEEVGQYAGAGAYF